jgi:hypothetical protein
MAWSGDDIEDHATARSTLTGIPAYLQARRMTVDAYPTEIALEKKILP